MSHDAVRAFVRGSSASLLQLLLTVADRSAFSRIICSPNYPVPVRTRAVREVADILQTERAANPFEFGDRLEALYASARPLASRKAAGQFFTPFLLAQWALGVVKPQHNDDICDPGCGAAVFASALVHSGFHVSSYVGIENDPLLALCGALVLDAINAPASFKIWYGNYFTIRGASFRSKGLRTPSLVIANPPFVRFHNLRSRSKILASLHSSIGVKLSAYSGSWGYFLARSIELASGDYLGARVAVLLPREAAGAAHARKLRSDLAASGWAAEQHPVPVLRPPAGGSRDKDRAELLAWLFVFTRSRARQDQSNTDRASSPRMGDVLEVKRGIATGCNDYFVMSAAEAARRGISERWLRRILPTRLRALPDTVTDDDWEKYRARGERCYVLSLPPIALEEFDEPVRTYLREGLQRGLHMTATARRLRHWYSLPVPGVPPDLFVTYLFRGAPRLILNSARLYHLTNILGARFRWGFGDEAPPQSLITVLRSECVEYVRNTTVGREYRDGLRKLEPKEVEAIPVSETVLRLAGIRHYEQQLKLRLG